MALAQCRECGRDVSTEAVSCPHCGVPRPSPPRSSAHPAPGATGSSSFKAPVPPQTQERKPEQTAGSAITPQASMYSSRPAGLVERLLIMKDTSLSWLLFCTVLGLAVVILWWIIWGGSGDISGRVSIAESRGADPVANTYIFLVNVDKRVEDFRKALEAYVNAKTVLGQARAAVEALAKGRAEPEAKEKLDEATARSRDAARRTEYAKLQLLDTEFLKGLADADLKIFREALSGKKVTEPKELKTFRFTRTDFDGHFEFKGIPQGKYYVLLFAYNLRDADPEYYWMVPVQVSRGAQVLDLSNSNVFTANRVGSAVAAASATPPARQQEEPHQPKWLIEEKARYEREAQQRQQEMWQLVQTVYEGKVTGDISDALNDILRNPDKFLLSQAVVASSLSKTMCRLTADRTATKSARWSDKKVEREDRVVLVSDTATTGGLYTTNRTRTLTVQVWTCVEEKRNEARE